MDTSSYVIGSILGDYILYKINKYTNKSVKLFTDDIMIIIIFLKLNNIHKLGIYI